MRFIKKISINTLVVTLLYSIVAMMLSFKPAEVGFRYKCFEGKIKQFKISKGSEKNTDPDFETRVDEEEDKIEEDKEDSVENYKLFNSHEILSCLILVPGNGVIILNKSLRQLSIQHLIIRTTFLKI